jgi:hypothetical protein
VPGFWPRRWRCCSRRGAERHTVYVALATFLTLAVPHLAYHAANPAPGLTDAEDVRNVVTLAIVVVVAVILGWGHGTHTDGRLPEGVAASFESPDQNPVARRTALASEGPGLMPVS